MVVVEDFVSTLATVVTLATNATTVYAMYLIWRQKATTNFLLVPYIVMSTSSLCWAIYGAMTETLSVEFVSAINGVFNISYVVLYVRYAQHRKQSAFMALVGGSSLTSYLLYFRYSLTINPMTAVNELGMVCDCITIVSFFSPLAALGDVLRTKSSESIPLALVVMNFLVSGLWWYYGYLLHDSYIVFPNMIGCFFAFIQLLLCIVFPRRPAQSSKDSNAADTANLV